eukprot:gene11326-15190_t
MVVCVLSKINQNTSKTQLVVLVTGCSSGIGKQAALDFAKDERFKVWATMRDVSAWDLPPIDGLSITAMDVTDSDSVDTAVAEIIASEGHIDILINNAGYGIAGCLEVVKLEEAQAVFDVNVWGVVRVLQAVLPFMRNRRFGYVINISSTSGIRGIPCFEYYTGSKFALEGIMDSLRYSMSPYNISITNVNAGPVKTAFIDKFGVTAVGGRGTRSLDNLNDNNGYYLQELTDRMIAGLNRRFASDSAQSTQEISQLLINIVSLKLQTKRITDVPFNVASSYDSQQILEEVKVLPTGWGGLYSDILKGMPPLVEKNRNSIVNEL